MRPLISLLILSLGLLCLPVAASQRGPSSDQEIAILTIRQDKIRTRTTAELLPVARYAGGRFDAIDAELGDTQSCPESRFHGSKTPGAKYDIFLNGLRVGEATAQRPEVGGYSCSGLCVVTAETTVNPNLAGVKYERRGFDPSGDFNESVTQFVALSPSSSRKEFRTVPIDPPSKAVRHSVLQLVTTRLRKNGDKPNATAKVELEDLRLFYPSPAGGLHSFVRAVVFKDASQDEFRAISAVVNIRGGKADVVLWDLVSEGGLDKGAAHYEFLDAIDLNGDSRSELLAIYHDYEFHEFQIIELTGGSYEVIHKGPSYGC